MMMYLCVSVSSYVIGIEKFRISQVKNLQFSKYSSSNHFSVSSFQKDFQRYSHIKESINDELKLTNPETLAILTIYFVQGAIGISRLALTYFMKDTLHLSPADLAAIQGISVFPWIIKPFYGFLSDGYPIFGYKRRSYLILSGIIGCVSWLLLGSVVHDTIGTLLATTLGSLSIAISDVVADSIVVEKSRMTSTKVTDSSEEEAIVDQSQAGNLQSLCWTSAAFGSVLSSYFSGSLLEIISIPSIFIITSLFPLLISISSFFIEEKIVMSSKMTEFFGSTKQQLIQLKDVILSPSIYLPVFFIFMWQATPSSSTAMFYFMTNVLHFSPEFNGRISFISSIASLVGVLLYRTCFKDVSIKKLILGTTWASVLLSLLQLLLTTRYNIILGIPDQAFSLVESSVLSVLGQLAFMPTLVLAAKLCPPGIEGTLFASLMSIYNFAGVLSSEIGAGITSLLDVTDTKFDNLSLLVLITSLSNLIPLLFIGLLDTSEEQNKDKQ